jgi:hypothetical protein
MERLCKTSYFLVAHLISLHLTSSGLGKVLDMRRLVSNWDPRSEKARKKNELAALFHNVIGIEEDYPLLTNIAADVETGSNYKLDEERKEMDVSADADNSHKNSVGEQCGRSVVSPPRGDTAPVTDTLEELVEMIDQVALRLPPQGENGQRIARERERDWEASPRSRKSGAYDAAV